MIIERKRGIKKARIVHNKKLFWIIIFLIIILGFLIYFIFQENKNKKDVVLECEKDIDCVKVQTGCCDCSMGGEEKCIPFSEEGNYTKLLRNCDRRTICTAIYACNIQSCGCIDNKCIAMSK